MKLKSILLWSMILSILSFFILQTNACRYKKDPIHLAAEQGEIAEVERLIALDPKNLEAKDPTNATPLVSASRHGEIEAVRVLLDHGANVEGDMKYQFPLSSAARGDSDDIVDLLLERGANINASTKNDGYTALMCAAENLRVATVAHLLKAGADVHIRSKISKETVLDQAKKPLRYLKADWPESKQQQQDIIKLLEDHIQKQQTNNGPQSEQTS